MPSTVQSQSRFDATAGWSTHDDYLPLSTANVGRRPQHGLIAATPQHLSITDRAMGLKLSGDVGRKITEWRQVGDADGRLHHDAWRRRVAMEEGG